jgi:cyclic dehypoxanthinyl futalosine synthase
VIAHTPRDGASLAKELNIDAVVAGSARLSTADAMRLFREASLHDLGRWSTAMADRILDAAGEGSICGTSGAKADTRTYILDRNINYTNVCSAGCTFCAFKRDLGDADAYILSTEQLHTKIQQLVDIGGTQILLQGGMHPELPLSFYEDMLRGIKQRFPHMHVHGFSPPEVVEFVAVCELEGFPSAAPGKGDTLDAAVWSKKLEAILRRLQAAGLDSLPGGGGEIFAEHVRRRIGVGKATAKQWLDVMSMAHRLGMFTSATMMFGHVEGVADRIDHMARVRQAQDRAIAEKWPGRYVSFIAWPFQRENTPLGRLPEFDREAGEPFPGDVLADAVAAGRIDGNDRAACDKVAPKAGKVNRMASATDYLRMQAISRLFLDNIHSIGSSWVTMGPKIGQLALYYGAADMGSVMMEENVVSAAGTTYCLNEQFLCHLIRGAGYIPAQRDNRYRVLHRHEGEQSPDLQVKDWSEHRAKKLHHEHAET